MELRVYKFLSKGIPTIRKYCEPGDPPSCRGVSRGEEVWVSAELSEHQQRMSVKQCLSHLNSPHCPLIALGHKEYFL